MRKKKKFHRKRRKRLKAVVDLKFWQRFNFIAGCDEAGRGPLAGPVVAAAVIMPKNFHHPEVNDSKKLKPEKREKLFKIIQDSSLAFSFGIVEPEVIDEINILNATKMAMREAICNLKIKPDVVLIDALKIEDLPFPQIPIIKGDSLSFSIACASILAKVKRDSIMLDYHKKYPQYHFNRHKGYPTLLHRKCIKEYGLCPIHRRTFRLL
uniref:Ribonuclease HII n=1 Tax=candidate division WOR-3 bacterium TaxID=2052148 RepID=A0A7C4TCZ9_UNCW3